MNVGNLCSVTKELVYEVANMYPDYLISEEKGINIPATLFALGFYIDKGDYLKGVRVVEDVYVRTLQDPEHVYKTKLYTGVIRKAVRSVKGGKIIYKKDQYHFLKPYYEKNSVLQPNTLEKYVCPEDIKVIFKVGEESFYGKE